MSDMPGVVAQMNGDDPAILLAHEPDQFVTVPDRVALTLSRAHAWWANPLWALGAGGAVALWPAF